MAAKYVASVIDFDDVDHDLTKWFAVVDEDAGGIVAYFSTLELANAFAVLAGDIS
jgi:hypothetical protein|tara:strand:+ start:58 stop:222 length:165 start_codon:yes stop_codon:yes gene_type:complete